VTEEVKRKYIDIRKFNNAARLAIVSVEMEEKNDLRALCVHYLPV